MAQYFTPIYRLVTTTVTSLNPLSNAKLTVDSTVPPPSESYSTHSTFTSSTFAEKIISTTLHPFQALVQAEQKSAVEPITTVQTPTSYPIGTAGLRAENGYGTITVLCLLLALVIGFVLRRLLIRYRNRNYDITNAELISIRSVASESDNIGALTNHELLALPAPLPYHEMQSEVAVRNLVLDTN